MSNPFSRRQIIKTGFMAAIGSSIAQRTSAFVVDDGASTASNNDPWRGFKTGIASYTFRKLNLDNTIKAMQRLDLHYISIKYFHLSLYSSTEERKLVIQQFKTAGITPLSCGNITMENDEAN